MKLLTAVLPILLSSQVYGSSSTSEPDPTSKTLDQWVAEIPSCCWSSLRDSTKAAGCNVDSVDAKLFDCMCTHLYSIVSQMTQDLSNDSDCLERKHTFKLCVHLYALDALTNRHLQSSRTHSVPHAVNGMSVAPPSLAGRRRLKNWPTNSLARVAAATLAILVVPVPVTVPIVLPLLP